MIRKINSGKLSRLGKKIITEMMFIIHLMRSLGGVRQNGKKKKNNESKGMHKLFS